MEKQFAFIRRLVLITCVAVGGCGETQQPIKGFILPPGDIEKGKTYFVEMGCPTCHTIAESDITQPESAKFHVQLGGETRRVKHYGDLLTSVINPDHRVSGVYRVQDESGKKFSSPMPDFTGQMTVAQLIDLVEFLHSTYSKAQPDYTGHVYNYGP